MHLTGKTLDITAIETGEKLFDIAAVPAFVKADCSCARFLPHRNFYFSVILHDLRTFRDHEIYKSPIE